MIRRPPRSTLTDTHFPYTTLFLSLVRWRTAPESDEIRNDTGVVEGSEISMFYDPMISKLCAYGKDRDEAVSRLSAALDETWIAGIGHNVNFLSAVLDHPRFRKIGRASCRERVCQYE